MQGELGVWKGDDLRYSEMEEKMEEREVGVRREGEEREGRRRNGEWSAGAVTVTVTVIDSIIRRTAGSLGTLPSTKSGTQHPAPSAGGLKKENGCWSLVVRRVSVGTGCRGRIPRTARRYHRNIRYPRLAGGRVPRGWEVWVKGSEWAPPLWVCCISCVCSPLLGRLPPSPHSSLLFPVARFVRTTLVR